MVKIRVAGKAGLSSEVAIAGHRNMGLVLILYLIGPSSYWQCHGMHVFLWSSFSLRMMQCVFVCLSGLILFLSLDYWYGLIYFFSFQACPVGLMVSVGV